MKKKISIILLMIAIILSTFTPSVAYADINEPIENSVSSTITLEHYTDLSITNEILNVDMNGSIADINIEYTLKNNTDKDCSSQAMFLAPNVENGKVTTITVDGTNLDYETESYFNTQVSLSDGWKYGTTDNDNNGDVQENILSFNLDFKASEEITVIISFQSQLGGFPNNEEYPIYGHFSHWWVGDLQKLHPITINVNVDETLPIMETSNIEFEKIDDLTYQHKSDSLTFSHFHPTFNPYLTNWEKFVINYKYHYKDLYILFFGIPILITIIILAIIFINIRLVKKSKLKKLQENDTNTIDKKNLY